MRRSGSTGGWFRTVSGSCSPGRSAVGGGCRTLRCTRRSRLRVRRGFASVAGPGVRSGTPSGCSSRPWGWTRPKLRTPKPPTAGPGSSSPPTPSSGSPDGSPRTYDGSGRNPPSPAASPPPASAAGFGTSARPSPARPAHRNPPHPAPDDRQVPPTASPPPIHGVGKTIRREKTLAAHFGQAAKRTSSVSLRAETVAKKFKVGDKASDLPILGAANPS